MRSLLEFTEVPSHQFHLADEAYRDNPTPETLAALWAARRTYEAAERAGSDAVFEDKAIREYVRSLDDECWRAYDDWLETIV